MTSADLVLAEERGEQGDCQKGEQVTIERSVTNEQVATTSAEDLKDQQGEEGDQGIRRRTRAVTVDPVMETGADEIEFPLPDWQATTGGVLTPTQSSLTLFFFSFRQR